MLKITYNTPNQRPIGAQTTPKPVKMAYVFIQFKPVSLTRDIVLCINEQLLLIKQKEKQIHEEHENKFHDTLFVFGVIVFTSHLMLMKIIRKRYGYF